MARRKSITHETENTDRWMVSYADFVTLLFAFFVVMYAISSVNEGKYRVLSDTLTDAFKAPPKSPTPIQIGKTTPKSVNKEGLGKQVIKTIKTVEPIEKIKPAEKVKVVEKVKILPKPERTYEREMKQIAETVSKSVQPLIDKGLIKVKQHKLWVEVEMNTKILFTSANSEIEDEALPALKSLANVLKTLPNHIDVEGHTDNIPIKNEFFPSNWELSAARAASVVNLFSKYGVDPTRLSSIGYGQYRPIASNASTTGRLRNRRVKVVILADKNARRIVEINRDIGHAGREGESSSDIDNTEKEGGL